MTRPRALPALLLACLVPLAAACAGARRPLTPPLPMQAAWKTLLGEPVVPPLAGDSRRVYVATRGGTVRALDQTTGEVAWKAEGLPGRISAADGALLVRAEDGTLTSLQPRTGRVRWTAATGVAGSLAAVIDEDRALVAGGGLAAVELASGRLLWRDAAGEVTAPPVRSGERLLAGEADGTLRCRDRASGATVWTLRTGGALLAPPLVDTGRRRLYLGTTDKRILQLRQADGDTGWRWTVGGDVAAPGLLLPKAVVFASFDAALYALRPGGNLAWRAGLPSRPLSGPLLVDGHVLVACLENELVAFAADSGLPAGSMRTGAEIRTPPLRAGRMLALGLRDRSVIAYALPGAAPAAPPEEPPATATGEPPAQVEAPLSGR